MCVWKAVRTKQELLICTCMINRDKNLWSSRHFNRKCGSESFIVSMLNNCFPTLFLPSSFPRNLWKWFSPFSHEFQYNVMSPLWLLHQLCLARTWLRSNRASNNDWEKGLDSLSGYMRWAKSVLILKGDNLRILGIHPVSLQKPNLNLYFSTKFEK